MRDRAPAPLPSEIRVLREAATYYLCEIALDTAARGALENLEVAEARVAEREDAVRVRLSRAVADAGDSLQTAMNALGTLDAFVSRALFAQRYETCVPEISVAPAVSFSDARLLPLEELLSARGHRYAPLSLSLEGVGVLTGPNMGGKTAALHTVGFVAACVVLGLPVPAASARVALFDEMAWIGMGAEGEGASLLSSFGREVAQLRDFLARKPGRPLVLVDEFARTTSPREGRALLVALVERLRDGDAVGLVATHLSGIAEDAHAPHYAVVGLRESPKRSDGAIDLDAAIDRIADVMDYRVRRVTADEEVRADAIALADVLGLDASLIVRARSAL
jgi:DNA mismatch repair ATPase MutS